MPISITITGDAAEVREQMAALLGHGSQPPILIDLDPPQTPAERAAFKDAVEKHVAEGPQNNALLASLEPTSPPEEPRRRGRPRRDAGSAEAPAASPEPASSTATPAAEPSSPAEVMTAAEAEASQNANAVPAEASLEDVRDALRSLAAAKGTDPCSALLKKFGASKSSELKPEHRAAFVAEAKELETA